MHFSKIYKAQYFYLPGVGHLHKALFYPMFVNICKQLFLHLLCLMQGYLKPINFDGCHFLNLQLKSLLCLTIAAITGFGEIRKIFT